MGLGDCIDEDLLLRPYPKMKLEALSFRTWNMKQESVKLNPKLPMICTSKRGDVSRGITGGDLSKARLCCFCASTYCNLQPFQPVQSQGILKQICRGERSEQRGRGLDSIC